MSVPPVSVVVKLAPGPAVMPLSSLSVPPSTVSRPVSRVLLIATVVVPPVSTKGEVQKP